MSPAYMPTHHTFPLYLCGLILYYSLISAPDTWTFQLFLGHAKQLPPQTFAHAYRALSPHLH